MANPFNLSVFLIWPSVALAVTLAGRAAADEPASFQFVQPAPESAWKGVDPEKLLRPEIKRARLVKLNLEPFQQPGEPQPVRLQAALFDDVSVTLSLKPLPQPSAESRAWSGFTLTSDGSNPGHATVVIRRSGVVHNHVMQWVDQLSARIQTGAGQVFLIRPHAGKNVYLVSEVDLTKLRRSGQSPPRPVRPSAPPAPVEPCDDNADEIQIDLLIVYTEEARLQAGETGKLSLDIDLAVADATACLTNSQVAGRFFVVHKEEVAYPETGDLITTLPHLQSKDDNHLTNVHALRDMYSADLVVLVLAHGNYAGLANTMEHGENAPGFEELAFSVVVYLDMVCNLTLPHELGHNLGGLHPGDTMSVPLFSYSFGHNFEIGCTKYCTVMGPNWSHLRIPYYSNPLVNYQMTAPTGNAATANMAETLRETLPTAAAFRP